LYKFSPQQISKILKEFDNGKSVEELCREHGLNSSTFYKWRTKYTGMSNQELKRMKERERENTRLKHQMAKEVIEKKL